MTKELITRINRKHLLGIVIVVPLLLLVFYAVAARYKSSRSKSEITQIPPPDKAESMDADSKAFQNTKAQVPLKNVNPSQKILAQLKDIFGEIRVKRAFSATWNQVFTGVDLYDGDQVYGGSVSAAKVVYTRDGSQISLSGYSLLRIAQLPPLKSEYSRGSTTNSEFVPPEGTTEFAYLMKDPGGQAVKAPKLSDAEVEALRQRSIVKDKIVILGPAGNLMLFAKSFPAPLAVRLERLWDNTKLWAYIWDQSQSGSAPVWTGPSRGSFSKVLIPKPGIYFLVIKSEDGRAESQIMEIAASLRVEKEFPVLGFDQHTHKNLTVVYQ
ncbi:MAG: hypothetical protein WCI18_00245 [Pseudomonadota bacterium]